MTSVRRLAVAATGGVLCLVFVPLRPSTRLHRFFAKRLEGQG